MSISVRALMVSDKKAWQQLFAGYLTFYEAELSGDVIELTWQRLLAADEPIYGVVAVDQGKPIGLAHYQFHRSTWSPTYYCYLEDLFVDPDCRASGAGRALIKATYAAADAKKCTRVYWSTQETNYQARGLYDKVAVRVPFVQYRRTTNS